MAGHKILVIDDSRVIRNTVRDMLPPGNFEILEAKDGLEGMNLIYQSHPNLIMLDFLLPKMSGWEVFQQIQSKPELQSIPLVLMSGRKEEVTEKISEPFEYFEFIPKPFDQKQLIAAIKTAMAKARNRPVVVPSAPQPAVAKDTVPPDSGVASADIQQLNAKIAKMQAEIDALKKQVAPMAAIPSEVDGLKKQLAQIVTFIKQKLK
ncbi:response regulator [Coleofasciculus sp. FACHB-64]|uniref:response regulator n=1 Tax=Cyanophyceae TaxID=3028117 RepID=UPI001681EDB8|nr:response regulator [Coleofasciculus sp. FACHB-501]MBD1877609.1 response regulator [Coleofasciculus sp. FACHB-T130]MBD1898156.1 response regulator [Coleofasciculus sp. FACHB-129]MBD1899613.1 response regulator [Coleofasciculus sp. FACHB-125]MBD2048267.1 response regulator [Coleofasciculus sp. FACHB-64]MBD2086968.1 response regulator [Coleofasciculus sp. FACHB-542]MBD2541710.1 response regulator [Coleofasciculus sp. FACHB-SPT36]